MAMMGAFNVQLISPDHAIELPQEAVLRTSLTHSGRRGYIEVDMELREDAYFIKYPAHVLSDNTNAASALLDASGGQFVIPAMEVHDLSGFTFNESTVENLLPLGVPVTINLRYGDVRVDTMFQWVGRPPSIPFNDGVDFLR